MATVEQRKVSHITFLQNLLALRLKSEDPLISLSNENKFIRNKNYPTSQSLFQRSLNETGLVVWTLLLAGGRFSF